MTSRVPIAGLGALIVAGALAGCAALPADGPTGGAIRNGATSTLVKATDTATLNYAFVDLSRRVLDYNEASDFSGLNSSFGGGRGGAPSIVVGIGDVVQVSIFESSEGGLFIPKDAGSRPGNYVTLPQQTVDQSGNISVPYAGLIRAAGRAQNAIQADIQARLENRAIEPQVVVALITQRATQVAVTGDVNAPNKFDINPSGDRILDIIARAGGLKYEGWESFVTLQRRGRSATVYFNSLVRNPRENIYVYPGDTVYVYREQRSFLAFGASGQSGQFNFQDETTSMAEGVAQAGGLLDTRADPSQVYLYRDESRAKLVKMGVDVSRFPSTRERIPTIYRADFRDPASFFVAKHFALRDKDVVYVSNAASVELFKFLDIVNGVSTTVAGVPNQALITRDAIRGF